MLALLIEKQSNRIIQKENFGVTLRDIVNNIAVEPSQIKRPKMIKIIEE